MQYELKHVTVSWMMDQICDVFQPWLFKGDPSNKKGVFFLEVLNSKDLNATYSINAICSMGRLNTVFTYYIIYLIIFQQCMDR